MKFTPKPMIGRRCVLAKMLGLALPALTAAPARAAPKPALVRYTKPRRFRIRHRLSVTNGDLELNDLELWLPVPLTWPEQEVAALEIVPEAELLRDATEHVCVARRLLLDGLPGPGQSRRLEVSYTVTCRKAVPDRRRLARLRYETYRKDRQYRLFTRAEKKIATGLAAIQRQAERFRGTNRPAYDVARAAYEWVLERTTYRKVNGIRGASWCVEHGAGECGDYAALFVAVCRAAGVPARPVTGLWADKENGWHCWAEFMLPGGQWVPVDCSLGDQSTANRHHYFGATDNERVALAKSYDVFLPNVERGQGYAEFLQGGAWWWHTKEPLDGRRRPVGNVEAVGTELDTEPGA